MEVSDYGTGRTFIAVLFGRPFGIMPVCYFHSAGVQMIYFFDDNGFDGQHDLSCCMDGFGEHDYTCTVVV
jgi:hypothetical protein